MIRTQLKLFKNAGGRKVVPGDLQRIISALPSPPEIILDGLFGYLHSLEDLWDDEDKVACVELIKWANSLHGRRISIDKPAVAKSVVDEDIDVILAAEWIIEVGALKENVTVDKGVRVFIVDLGLGKRVWKGINIAGAGKKRKGDLGINWNGKWVVEVETVL
jgi:enhancer of mRNA-decapping protein 3